MNTHLILSFIAAYLASGIFRLALDLSERSIDQSAAVRQGRMFFFVFAWPISNWQSHPTPAGITDSIAMVYDIISEVRRYIVIFLAAMPVLLPFWVVFFVLRTSLGLEGIYFWLVIPVFLISVLIPGITLIFGVIFGMPIGLLWIFFHMPILILLPKNHA